MVFVFTDDAPSAVLLSEELDRWYESGLLHQKGHSTGPWHLRLCQIEQRFRGPCLYFPFYLLARTGGAMPPS